MAAAFSIRRARCPIFTACIMGLNLGPLAFVSTLPLAAAETNSPQATAPPPPELRLEDVLTLEIPTVEGASKYRQKTTEAPASVTILTSDDVKRYGYRTLSDLLQSARGLYTSYDRNYSFLGIRGFNRGDFNSRVLLVVDGHRINNSLSDGAPIGTDFILDVDLIEKVEIIRGPGSSLYGNNAFFGVVNVITRKGRDLSGVGGEVSVEGASFDTYKGRATYGHKFKSGLDLILSGSWYDSAGQRSLYYPDLDQRTSGHFLAANNGLAEKRDGDQYQSFFGTLAFQDFTLQGAWSDRKKGNPTAQFFTTFNDGQLRTDDERSYLTLKYAHEFPEIMDVHAQIYYDRYDFDISSPSFGFLFKDVRVAEWWGMDLQLTKELFERHKLIFGAEYRDDFHQARRVFDVQTPTAPFQDLERNRKNYGFYLQGDAAMLTNLHLNVGFRYDQYGDQEPAVNPRFALIGDPFEKTTLKFIYGSAFRAPNFFELIPFPDITPETITSYEAIYEQGIGRHFRSSLSGFYNQIEDLITFDAGRFKNLSGADSKGVEAELQGFWASGWRGRLGYTCQRTTDSATGMRLTDSPQHLGKFNLSAPLLKDKLFASLEVQYSSSRKTLAGGEASGFGVVNFTLFSKNLMKGLEASVSVYNLLDKQYSDPATPSHVQDLIERDGRGVRAQLTYRF